MKSMQKVSRGKGFKGVLSYNLADGKGRLVGGTVCGSDVDSLAREFSAIAQIRSDIEKPVWHQSLRLPVGEKLTTDQFIAVADSYMAKMGLGDHQYALILDDMEDGQHMHIVANRIHPDGSVYLGKNENLKSSRICGQLEKDFGLEQTKQAKNSQRRAIAEPSKNEVEMALRIGEQPPKVQIQNAIDQALQNPCGLEQFRAELSDLGVQSVATTNKNGLVGFRFALSDSDVWFKGSQLGKDFSKKQLLEKGLIDDSKQNEESARAETQANRNEQSDSGTIRGNSWTKGSTISSEPGIESAAKAIIGDSATSSLVTKIKQGIDRAQHESGQKPVPSLAKAIAERVENKLSGKDESRQNLAYRFFTRDFVANAEFSHLVRFHDYKTQETSLDTGFSKGVVKATDSTAIASTDSAEHNADLLLNYANLRNWHSVTTGSMNPEFLHALDNQAWQMNPKIEVNFTDEQISAIADFKASLDSGIDFS